jgi:hypothetical protein
MLTAIWHMGGTGTLYDDPGAEFFTRLHPERVKNRAPHQLEAMGYYVTLDRGVRSYGVDILIWRTDRPGDRYWARALWCVLPPGQGAHKDRG